jgi:hypothetical protein
VSIKLMSIVWDLHLPPGEKLVLLALADQANDEGVQCWPAVSTIARRSGQGERTVRRALADLESKGHLTRQHRDGASTQYVVHPCQNGTPAKSAPLPNTTVTPANLAAKPSITIKTSEAIASSVTRTRSKAGTRLPNDFKMPESWAAWVIAERGWSRDAVADEAAAFRDYWIAKPGASALKLDWAATWRNWVRNSRRRSGAADHPGGPTGFAADFVFGAGDGTGMGRSGRAAKVFGSSQAPLDADWKEA